MLAARSLLPLAVSALAVAAIYAAVVAIAVPFEHGAGDHLLPRVLMAAGLGLGTVAPMAFAGPRRRRSPTAPGFWLGAWTWAVPTGALISLCGPGDSATVAGTMGVFLVAGAVFAAIPVPRAEGDAKLDEAAQPTTWSEVLVVPVMLGIALLLGLFLVPVPPAPLWAPWVVCFVAILGPPRPPGRTATGLTLVGAFVAIAGLWLGG